MFRNANIDFGWWCWPLVGLIVLVSVSKWTSFTLIGFLSVCNGLFIVHGLGFDLSRYLASLTLLLVRDFVSSNPFSVSHLVCGWPKPFWSFRCGTQSMVTTAAAVIYVKQNDAFFLSQNVSHWSIDCSPVPFECLTHVSDANAHYLPYPLAFPSVDSIQMMCLFCVWKFIIFSPCSANRVIIEWRPNYGTAAAVILAQVATSLITADVLARESVFTLYRICAIVANTNGVTVDQFDWLHLFRVCFVYLINRLLITLLIICCHYCRVNGQLANGPLQCTSSIAHWRNCLVCSISWRLLRCYRFLFLPLVKWIH